MASTGGPYNPPPCHPRGRCQVWASFEESIKGTLAPGKLGDIAVFDTNLVEAGRTDPARLLEAKVRYTIVGGRIVSGTI